MSAKNESNHTERLYFYTHPWIRSDESICKLLLKNGANVNVEVPEFGGETALHAACLNQEAEDVRLLLQYGADINIMSEYGQTPLTAMEDEPRHKKTLMKHLAMMRFKDQPICDENLEYVRQNEDLQKIFNRCSIELKKMKNLRIYDNYTLYDVLLSEHDCMKLFLLLRNKNFVAAFKSCRNRKFFKYFGQDVDRILQKVAKIKNAIESEEKKLYLIFKDCLPLLVIRKIAFFSKCHLFLE